jgi:hypothetical protein
MNGAGKGDTYRKVNKKVSDENYEKAFGKKDVEEFQKCHKYVIKEKPKDSSLPQ